MRLIAVGDIHGQLGKLDSLLVRLNQLPLKPEDRLIFLGDYIDRGPDVPGVIERMIAVKSERPNSVFLRGNHDQAMLTVRNKFGQGCRKPDEFENVMWWFSFGGKETINAYGGPTSWLQQVPETHWNFLDSTELEHREPGYIFVHAGLVPKGKTWSEPEDPRMWVRDMFIDSKEDFGAIVVFGHTPQDLFMPLVMSNKVGIDTGAAYGGPLTAFIIDPTQKYVPREAKFLSSN